VHTLEEAAATPALSERAAPAVFEVTMDNTTILIVILLVLMLGGGGFFWSRRGRG
jgi:LPXTG-motif cell wall-anchored protein